MRLQFILKTVSIKLECQEKRNSVTHLVELSELESVFNRRWGSRESYKMNFPLKDAYAIGEVGVPTINAFKFDDCHHRLSHLNIPLICHSQL